MSRLDSALAHVAATLDPTKTAWALVRGLAVSAGTEPRFTRDVDIAVSVNHDREAEELIRALRDGQRQAGLRPARAPQGALAQGTGCRRDGTPQR